MREPALADRPSRALVDSLQHHCRFRRVRAPPDCPGPTCHRGHSRRARPGDGAPPGRSPRSAAGTRDPLESQRDRRGPLCAGPVLLDRRPTPSSGPAHPGSGSTLPLAATGRPERSLGLDHGTPTAHSQRSNGHAGSLERVSSWVPSCGCGGGGNPRCPAPLSGVGHASTRRNAATWLPCPAMTRGTGGHARGPRPSSFLATSWQFPKRVQATAPSIRVAYASPAWPNGRPRANHG